MLTTAERDLLAVLGFHFLRYGRAGDAAVLFDALAEIAPAEPLYRLSAAHSHLESGTPQLALRAMDGLVLDGDDSMLPATARWLHARALFSLGHVEEARAAARQALTLRAETARNLSRKNPVNGET